MTTYDPPPSAASFATCVSSPDASGTAISDAGRGVEVGLGSEATEPPDEKSDTRGVKEGVGVSDAIGAAGSSGAPHATNTAATRIPHQAPRWTKRSTMDTLSSPIAGLYRSPGRRQHPKFTAKRALAFRAGTLRISLCQTTQTRHRNPSLSTPTAAHSAIRDLEDTASYSNTEIIGESFQGVFAVRPTIVWNSWLP